MREIDQRSARSSPTWSRSRTSTPTCAGSPSAAATSPRSPRRAPTRSSTCCCRRRAATELTIDQSLHAGRRYAEMPEADTARRRLLHAAALAARRRTSSTCCACCTATPARRRPGRQRARPGDPVALWGPRTAYAPPAGTDWYLLVADETGLPAVAAILESLPEGTVGPRVRRGRRRVRAPASCPTSPVVRGHLAAPRRRARPARRRCSPTPCGPCRGRAARRTCGAAARAGR